MIPSVTQVLKPWSNYSHVPPDVLEAATERGKKVHSACFALCLGVWAPKLPEEWQGYFKSFEWWLTNAVEEVVLVEPEFYSIPGRPRFMGHPDLVVRMKGDEYLSIPDIKTPLVHSKAWQIQCAAYRALARDNDFKVARNFSLRLKKDGSQPLVNDYSGTYLFDLAVFQNALACWRFFNG